MHRKGICTTCQSENSRSYVENCAARWSASRVAATAGARDRAGAPSAAPLPALAALREDAALARDCALLVEADVLPSIGLSVDYGWRLQARLAREWHRPLGARDKIQFVEHVFGPFVVGAFFEPNRRRLRDACLVRLQTEDDAGAGPVPGGSAGA